MGRGIEAPTFNEVNEFLVSIYASLDKSPLVLKEDKMNELEVIVIGPGGQRFPTKVHNNGDGTYNVS